MVSIQGIGGVFIDSMDAERLACWYEETLGVAMETHPDGIGYYHVFATRDVDSSLLRENPVFAINQATETLAEQGRGFVLNLRVDDLYGLLEKLRAKNVTVEDRILEWERGKHGWIRDLDGNKVELYEEILPDETRKRDPKLIALQFNECINNQDIEGLANLMADDYRFVDSNNDVVDGKEENEKAWLAFFKQFPDYLNHFSIVESRDNQVLVTGHSTCLDDRLGGPAIWTAKVEYDLVAEWRVYLDTPENRKNLELSAARYKKR